MSKVTIEVCERLMDYWIDFDGVKRPKYHAQIKDNPGLWVAVKLMMKLLEVLFAIIQKNSQLKLSN